MKALLAALEAALKRKTAKRAVLRGLLIQGDFINSAVVSYVDPRADGGGVGWWRVGGHA